MSTAGAWDGLPIPQRHWSALAIWLAIGLAVLDATLANVALPAIARDLRIEPQDAIWVVNAYQIAIVATLLPLASLGEIVGDRRVYLGGLAVFVVASLGCALSRDLTELIGARAAQGLGAAGIMSINAALVRFTFPGKSIGRAIGWNALVVSIASAAGPSVAAGILSVASWPWLFAVNLPFGLLAFVVATYALPQVPTIARRFDLLGAAMNALAFGLLIGGIDVATRTAWPAAGIALGAAGVVFFALLAARGRGQASPLLPLDLMRIPIFALSVATSVCSFCAAMLTLVALPFLFDRVMHRSAAEIGLLLTPWPIAVGIVGPLAGALSDRMPAALLGAAGLLALAGGIVSLALMPPDAAFLDIAWRMGVCGVGFGLFQAPNNRTLVTSAPASRAGAAGGMLATARLTGQTLGATLAAVFFATSSTGAEHLALAVAAAIAALGGVASASRHLVRPPRGT